MRMIARSSKKFSVNHNTANILPCQQYSEEVKCNNKNKIAKHSSISMHLCMQNKNEESDSTKQQEEEKAALSIKDEKRSSYDKLRAQQKELLVAQRDPFSSIRIVIWSLLGLGGLVGTATTVMFNPAGQSIVNIGINVAVVLAMTGALYVELNIISKKGKDVIEQEVNNPSLKGDSTLYFDEAKMKEARTRAGVPVNAESSSDERDEQKRGK